MSASALSWSWIHVPSAGEVESLAPDVAPPLPTPPSLDDPSLFSVVVDGYSHRPPHGVSSASDNAKGLAVLIPRKEADNDDEPLSAWVPTKPCPPTPKQKDEMMEPSVYTDGIYGPSWAELAQR